MTILFLAVMALLFKFSEFDKAWLWFVVVVGLFARFGYELRMGGLIVAVAGFKVLKEIFRW